MLSTHISSFILLLIAQRNSTTKANFIFVVHTSSTAYTALLDSFSGVAGSASLHNRTWNWSSRHRNPLHTAMVLRPLIAIGNMLLLVSISRTWNSQVGQGHVLVVGVFDLSFALLTHRNILFVRIMHLFRLPVHIQIAVFSGMLLIPFIPF